jgi:putative endopeptidase
LFRFGEEHGRLGRRIAMFAPGRPETAEGTLHRSVRLALVAPLLLAASFDRPSGAVPSSAGIDVAGMDRAIQPGDDFYGYANGDWLKAAEIPPDRSVWGAFSVLQDEVERKTAELIREAGGPAGSDEAKVRAYYEAYMDEKAIEKRGLGPVKGDLAAIAAIADRTALARVMGGALRADVDPLNAGDFHTSRPFGLWVSPNFADPDRNVAYLLQGGLGMPDRDDYLNTDARSVDLQAKYRAHIVAVLKLARVADAVTRGARIYDLERKIAAVHVSRTDSVDVGKANNPWPLRDFPARAPGLDWGAYFEAAGLSSQPMIMVWQPSAVRGMAALAGSVPLDVWKDLLTFHALDRSSPLLPRAFADEWFEFHGRALTGARQPRDRWKRAASATSEALGDAVGKLYVRKYFPPEAKAAAQAMVRNIVAAFDRRIDRLEWMSPTTRARAREKVESLYVGIGYPEHWQSYSELRIERGDALGNVRRAGLFEYRRSLAKLDKPVDRSDWAMTPQTVNAVNLPLQNALNFPAAILNPPFFDASAEPARNYGAIGTVIGHEISHSFDDQGSQFDARGRLSNWWTPEDLAHFRRAAERLVAQYDAYEPLPGMHVNGKLTLSENIADVAGVAAAHDGYGIDLGGKPGPVIGGFTADQRFFLAFGQIWRSKMRPEALRSRLITDGHAPGPCRADTVRNIDAWYGAFDIRPGRRLYLAPTDRVQVW